MVRVLELMAEWQMQNFQKTKAIESFELIIHLSQDLNGHHCLKIFETQLKIITLELDLYRIEEADERMNLIK